MWASFPQIRWTLLINLSLALQNEEWTAARRVLVWTAGLPLLGLAGFLGHLVLFVMPLDVEYGPGVPLGWPPRFLLWTYMAWLVTLASQAIKVKRRSPPGDATTFLGATGGVGL